MHRQRSPAITLYCCRVRQECWQGGGTRTDDLLFGRSTFSCLLVYKIIHSWRHYAVVHEVPIPSYTPGRRYIRPFCSVFAPAGSRISP
jgi:hypothetical protein